MSRNYPIGRDKRVRYFNVTNGQSVFGPFSFKIWDVEDVELLSRISSTSPWEKIDNFTASLEGNAPAFFSITKTGLAAGLEMQVRGARLAERTTDATRGGSISSDALEKELDKTVTTLQEVRRDVSEALENSEQVKLQISEAVEGIFPPATITNQMLAAGVAVANLGFTPENSSHKNQVNGYAGVDENGTIPIGLIPELPEQTLTEEDLQDIVGGMLQSGGRLSISYDDPTGKITLTGPSHTDLLEAGSGINITNSGGKALISTTQAGYILSLPYSFSSSYNASECLYAVIGDFGKNILTAGHNSGASSPFTSGDLIFLSPLSVSSSSPAPTLPWISVTVGWLCVYAIDSAFKVYATGRNVEGQLGVGDTTDRKTLTYISAFSGSNVTNVIVPYVCGGSGSGSNAYFLLQNGQVWATGSNGSGQLGDGTTTNRNFPVRCGTITGVTKIISSSAATNSTGIMALSGSNLYAWGAGTSSALGSGSTANVLSPFLTLSSVKDFSYHLGYNGYGVYASAVAVMLDGSTKGIGYNGSGQLGDGTTTDRTAWIAGLVTTASLCAIGGFSGGTSAFLHIDNSVSFIGNNNRGQCGNGTTTSPVLTPYKPGASFQWKAAKIIVTGYNDAARVYILTSDGKIFSAGYGSYGGMGDGATTASKTAFTEINLPPQVIATDFMPCGQISSGGIAILTADKNLWFCGENQNGFMGLGVAAGGIVARPIRVVV